MKSFVALAALAALAACSSVGPPPPTERPVVEATACPDLNVTIYFDPRETAVPSSADPVIATVSETIRRCDARFSPVKRVEIAGDSRAPTDATAAAAAGARPG